MLAGVGLGKEHPLLLQMMSGGTERARQAHESADAAPQALTTETRAAALVKESDRESNTTNTEYNAAAAATAAAVATAIEEAPPQQDAGMYRVPAVEDLFAASPHARSEDESTASDIFDGRYILLRWSFLDVFRMLGRRRENVEGTEHAVPLTKQHKVVYVSHRYPWDRQEEPDPFEPLFAELQRLRPTLSQQFDGFFLYLVCLPLAPYASPEAHALFLRGARTLHRLSAHCYTLLLSDPRSEGGRAWIWLEWYTSLVKKRLIVNDLVLRVLRDPDMRPDYAAAKARIATAGLGAATDRPLIERMLYEAFHPAARTGAPYVLIPAEQLRECDIERSAWEDMKPVPLDSVTPSEVRPTRVRALVCD